MSISKLLIIVTLVLGGTLFYLNASKRDDHVVPLEAAVEAAVVPSVEIEIPTTSHEVPPDCDHMAALFAPHPPLLPIVETITYTNHVPWLVGRQAYLGDYASHYQTSKHFISRSLKGANNYFSEVISNGDRFNVLRRDKEIEFHLVLDLSRLKMWLYYYDATDHIRGLLKTYRVCAGRLNSERPSGSLTPTGVFKIGSEIAVYKEGVMGTFKNQPREIVTIFGKRWIPFEKEVADASGSCKGLGFHGVPWKKNSETGEYVEYRACIGHYESGGCIRLLTEDISELYALIVTKPSYVHIVKDFFQASLPGNEKFD